MKILYVITSLRTGGAERLLMDILPAMRDYGHEVEVLVFDGTATPFREQLEAIGIKVYAFSVGYYQMYNPLHYFRLRRFFAHHTYDIIHTNNTQCQLLVAMLHSKLPSRLVTTEHNTTNHRRCWSWYRKIDRWMYRQYDAIICVSDWVKNNLVNSLGDKAAEGRLHLVYNGVQTALYKSVPAKAPEDVKTIIMVAGFRAQKDQPTLIRAMSLLPENYQLLLVGDGLCWQSCRELAKSVGVADKILFTGDRTDIPQLLAQSDVAVLSSHFEGLPLTAIEAMAAGRPLIASDVDGIRQVVDGAGLLFPHQDYHKLAELIERVCTDDELRNTIIARSRDRAFLFDISNTIKAYNKIYTEL